MSFLRSLLKNRERQRLEQAAGEAPAPEVFLQLAEMHRQEGDLSGARQAAKRGLARFPGDAGLVSLERELAVSERQAEIQRLREQIANYPNPRLYARLAELYRAGNENDKARQVARAGLASSPDHAGLHHVMGELAHDAGQAEEAVEHLRKAAGLDKYNYSALKLLGKTLAGLGRHAEAAAAFADILAFAPDDEEVKELRAREQSAGGAQAPAAPAAEPETVRPGPAEPSGAGQEPPAPTAAPPPAATEKSEMDQALTALIGIEGIGGIVLADAQGLPLASALPPDMDEALAGATAMDVRRSAGPACGELGLGAFEDVLIETDAGSIYIHAIRDLTLAIFAAPGARPGPVELRARGLMRKLAELTGRD